MLYINQMANLEGLHKESLPLLEKYRDLPPLARLKTMILESGVSISDLDLLSSYPGIANYKTKYAFMQPFVENFQYIDKATNNTIVPSELLLTDGDNKSLVKVNFNQDSPLVLAPSGNTFIIADKSTGGIVPITIELVQNYAYTEKRLPKDIDPEEHLMTDCVQIVGQDRIGILAFEGCWHWNTKKACQFCDANPKREGFQTLMPSLNTLVDMEFDELSWWEKYGKGYLDGIQYTFKYIAENEQVGPHQHLQLMAGNMPHSETLWEICRQIAERINKVRPISTFDSYLNIGAPSKDTTQYLRTAKDEMGFRQIAFNLEVVGEERFKEVCPGKARTIGYANYVQALEQAVSIFGFGNVRSNFVLGAQPTEELIEGVRELAKKGIVADYSVFVPKQGTPWESKQSPDMQEIVRFTKVLADIYRQYNFKGIYCSLSSRSNILNEVLENQ